MTDLEIKDLLDFWAKEVEENAFIEFDPVQIPHRYSRLQDIEIAGFFAAIMAWGQRKTIIKSAQKLMLLMDDAPFDFITQHEPSDLKRFQSFVHRTLNGEDVVSMISFFRQLFYRRQLGHMFTRHLWLFNRLGRLFRMKEEPTNTWHRH